MLPSEVVIKVLNLFSMKELQVTMRVSRRWRMFSLDPSLYIHILIPFFILVFRWNTFENLILRPEVLDDAKVMG
jgi:hypothetical protein